MDGRIIVGRSSGHRGDRESVRRGATITNNDSPNEVATTAPTGDPSIPGGFYWMFATPSGSHSFTAAAGGYQPATATVDVRPNAAIRVDFRLTPG